MNQPFIRNHQYNLIKRQAGLLRKACETAVDPKVIESVRADVELRVSEAFPHATESERLTLGKLWTLRLGEEFESYLRSLPPFLEPFAPVTDAQLKKLFPKVKKLRTPDCAAIDFRYVTYLGWSDLAANKLFLVYRLDGQLVGIEGRMTPTNKKGTCFLCNRQEEVALFTAITKSKPPGASPDYYKAIGNYLCVNSEACNHNITDVTALEKFLREVVK